MERDERTYNERLSLHVTSEHYEYIHNLAEEFNTSMSTITRMIINYYIKKHEGV